MNTKTNVYRNLLQKNASRSQISMRFPKELPVHEQCTSSAPVAARDVKGKERNQQNPSTIDLKTILKSAEVAQD